jgi:hypothetical protein
MAHRNGFFAANPPPLAPLSMSGADAPKGSIAKPERLAAGFQILEQRNKR